MDQTLAQGSFGAGFLAALSSGTVNVPTVLITTYSKLGLTEQDMMFILHILTFKEKENIDFPTPEEIEARMDISVDQIMQTLSKLMKSGWLTIDEQIDPVSGIQYERYQLGPLYEKLSTYIQNEPDLLTASHGRNDRFQDDDTTEAHTARSSSHAIGQALRTTSEVAATTSAKTDKDIYRIFEIEFARPLSPMEAEMITGWEEQDEYPRELILFALKEAVFAGKLNFRYIDRILLEWQRNRVKTVEQAKEHATNFRGR